ncbi:MAG TPA: hypothetical protein VG206_13405 [Terriglobia bacterium]|nr:hypothetical protein [Terriglobia bacterium]
MSKVGHKYRFQIRVEGANESTSPLGWTGVTINVPTINSREQYSATEVQMSSVGCGTPFQHGPGDTIFGFRDDGSFGEKTANCLFMESVREHWPPHEPIALEAILLTPQRSLDFHVRVWSNRPENGGGFGDPDWKTTERQKDQQGIPAYALTVRFDVWDQVKRWCRRLSAGEQKAHILIRQGASQPPPSPDERLDQLIVRLRAEVGEPDWFQKRREALYSVIIAEGVRITPALAHLALEFDPDRPHADPNARVAAEAVCLIERIGHLDEKFAQALHKRFIRNRNFRELMEQPDATNWAGLYRQVGQTLQKLGYLHTRGVEPRFRIVPNNLAFLGEGQGLFAIQFECGQCGKTVQIPVNKLIKSGVGANVKCHSCYNITYVPPNAGKE